MESENKQKGAAPSPSPSPSSTHAMATAADHVNIPTENSPYVQYTNLEDYKAKAYGTAGHLPVVDRPHHGGATDAPTLSGTNLPQN